MRSWLASMRAYNRAGVYFLIRSVKQSKSAFIAIGSGNGIPIIRNIKNDILDVALEHFAEPVEGIHGKIVIVFQTGNFRWI
jgi:hypothetical protein